MINYHDGFDMDLAYSEREKIPPLGESIPPARSFLKMYPEEVGGLSREQVVEACKKMFPENFV